MAFKEKFSEKKQLIEEKEKELEEYTRKKNKSLSGTICTGIAVAGTIVVSATPAISNETLQYIAGMYQTVMPLLVGTIGLGAYNYKRYKRHCEELSNQIETERAKYQQMQMQYEKMNSKEREEVKKR